MLHIVRSSRCSDFDYAQDDTAGLENIKFVSFSAGASPRPTKFVRILVERTYFVGVGAHDDPKNNQ